ncbi:MAG: rhomboid family intramembrane serine protease [Myxococcales bacterium]|nr:rhomboid family intramembrane serine protease [Myxococcales bacterium]
MASGPRRGLGQTSITKGCLYLLVATLGLSLLFFMSKGEMRLEIARVVAASGQSIWHDFKLWQLVTSPFLEVEFIGLIFQGFMLWMFIPALERWWGTKRFLKFAAYTSVIGVVTGTLVIALIPAISSNNAITGLEPLIYSAIIAYGTLFANEQVQFFGVLPITGRQLTIGICGFMLLFVVLGQNWGEGAANVSAMLTAWVLTNGKWTPRIWLLKRKQARIRSRLRIVTDKDDPKGDGPTYLN